MPRSDDHLKRIRRELTVRAQERAAKSAKPGAFLNIFEDRLNALLNADSDAEDALLHQVSSWEDPVTAAAEAEALCAYRALKHWGTTEGLVYQALFRKAS